MWRKKGAYKNSMSFFLIYYYYESNNIYWPDVIMDTGPWFILWIADRLTKANANANDDDEVEAKADVRWKRNH